MATKETWFWEAKSQRDLLNYSKGLRHLIADNFQVYASAQSALLPMPSWPRIMNNSDLFYYVFHHNKHSLELLLQVSLITWFYCLLEILFHVELSLYLFSFTPAGNKSLVNRFSAFHY